VYGLSSVLNAAPVDLILSPVLKWDSKAFEFMLKYAEKQGTPISVPQEGDTLQLGEATVTILHCWPEAVDYGRTNDSSIVVKIDYGKTSFIITGDAEDWSEYMMIDAGVNLKADVLRIAHHGSNTASTREFLQAVQPRYAVISVGKDNGYGHPHQEVLNRLEEIESQVLRTDQLGTIIMQSDGEIITLK
jgi:competence protein ComEC